MKQTWRIRGGSSGHGSRHMSAADGILSRPDHGTQSGPSGGHMNNNTRRPIEAHREEILEHIFSHRVTFIQGDTGCGKSTAVPQFILEDATARGRHDSVRVIVAQPTRVAAVSLAQYVGNQTGMDVSYAVARERSCTSLKTRLKFVTSGYLLQLLARNKNAEKISHIILDEVHVRSVQQDLLLLLLRLLLAGIGNNGRRSSLSASKLIIMSATMDVRPLQEYFSCLQVTEEGQNVDPIIIRGRRFPVEIVHIDEILGYLPGLPQKTADLATRFVEISGTGARALDGTNLPHFAIDLVTGLVMHIGRAGDCVLVFVATFSDIFDIKQGFERVARSGDATLQPLDVMFLHSMLSREDQELAIEPPRPDTLKVIIATNIAESSLTIPNVRVVFDLGHQVQVEYCNKSGGTTSRVWCSKASARQRAGRAGRLFPGIVIRLYTRETFHNFAEFEKPDISLQDLGSTILQVKGLFQYQFPNFPVVELLQQLLDSPPPEDVSVSMKELQTLGAITSTSSSVSCELTLLGRLATELSLDIHSSRFVLLGVALGCAVDCVIIVAGITSPQDIFHQPLLVNRDSRDPMFLQRRRIANLTARMHFHGGFASDLLMYCQVYNEWVHNDLQSRRKEWIRQNELRESSVDYFVLKVRDYAEKTIMFVAREFGSGMQGELIKLRTLAAVDPKRGRYGRHETIPKFCDSVEVVQIAIAGAFSRNWLIGFPAKDLQGVAETRALEGSNMPAHLSFKLSNVPPNLARPDILKLEMALKVLGPIHKVVPFSERAVLVQCELHEKKMTSFPSPPVILDLPSTGRLANFMARYFSSKGELVIMTKENTSPTAKVEELYLGKPSYSRMIKWTVRMGNEVRRVRFTRLSLIPSAVEVRKDIPFHIAMAVNLSYTAGTSDIHAKNVTVLPQYKLFSVLVLLMFRTSSPDEELQVRILSNSNQIYSIKYQGMTLELAPRFICLTALKYIDGVRARIQGFMAGTGIENCNLARDMMNLLGNMQRTEYGTPVLAPKLGSWLAYPSLIPVREENAKVEESIDQLKLGSHKPPPGSPRMLKDPRSCPVLLQSRSDKYKSHHEANYQEPAHGKSASKVSNVHLFEQAFEAAELEVDRTQLIEWIGGDKSRNGICFELLKRLVRNSGHMERTKAVLQYVYCRRNGMVYQKQIKELEGLYHSICNPDLAHSMHSDGAFGKKAPKTVEVQKQNSHVHCPVVRSLTPEMFNEDSLVTRQVTVKRQESESFVSALEYEYFPVRITIGPFASSHPGLVTVSGKRRDVELALQRIQIIANRQRSLPWMIDDTYSDSLNMDGKVQCVYADGFQHDSSNPAGKESLEFLLVRDDKIRISHDNSYACGASSLFHPRMKQNFDKVLEGLNPRRNIQIQARLGRVIFACSKTFKTSLPFLDGQSKPLGELKKYLDRHQISKRRFDDTIPETEFYHLRTCLHLCHPTRVERHKNYIIVVSNPTASNERDREGKFKITDALDAPGRFLIQGVEGRTKLAVADIVRLNAGAIQVDVRLSMQANEDHEISEEARDFVRKIRRKGSKLEFPAEPYIVQLQRHKDSEYFLFDGFKVSLTNVKQIRAGVSRSKFEVEFEAIGSLSEADQEETAVPFVALTSKISLILKQVQSVCSQMSCIGPSSTATGVVQALLRSWTIEHDEIQLKKILNRELLHAPLKIEVVGEDQEEVSMQICSLIEALYHCDNRILKEGIDVAAELQLVLLHIMQSMTISLSQSIESRVKWFLSYHKLEPENALQYACLFKCHCSPSDRTWESVLHPYLMQLILENRSDVLEKLFSRFNLCHELCDYSHGQLVDAIMRSSIWTTLSALTRLFHRENVGMFLRLVNAAVTCEETIAPATNSVRCFVPDLLGLCYSKATAFVGKCLEWTIENESSIVDWKIHMQNVFWLLEIINTFNIFVDEHCRSKILDLLLRLPSSMEQKRELEESLLKTYRVDETQFRNRHYQRILQQLGYLQDSHKEELKRRGLDEKQCYDFNFQTWTPGKIRGRDIMGSSLIPGLNERGTRLIGSRGIFIPARDPSGQITGGQIKVDDNWTGKRKYVWLSSNNLFKGGNGPQIGGELPLFCCVPREGDTSVVGLCEGGLKAHVLAALSGLPVIGASGADFPRSKSLLQSYLVMMGVEQIVFFPDAGSQCNDQVTSVYFQTFRLLRDWGYNVLVAWWGQVNKTEHDDIDDYLAKNTAATELPLFSTFQFWQCVSLDVRQTLQSNFPEYKTPQVSDAVTNTALDTFTDDDHVEIVKMTETSGFGEYYQIKIPKEVMKNMPRAPDDYVTPQSVKSFTIEVLMVQTDDGVGVEAAINWLLPQPDVKTILGLDCEHGLNGDLNLIQVSTHQRCVLIRVITKNLPHPSRLAEVLREKKVVKSGAEVHNDALAIYHTLGLMVNGLKNVSPAYKVMDRTAGMLEIFRNLYGWEWTKKKAITRSDWGCANLTLEQIKYAALDAWASRMIALEGLSAMDETVTSLGDLPEELLKLFARAITNYSTLQRTEKTVFETSGNIIESSRSTLRLLQQNFRSRVTSIGSRVELRFNDGQKPALFEARTRTGKSVVLTPLSNESTATNPSSSKAAAFPVDISSISHVIVDNSKSHHPQLRQLREIFYDLLCHPDRCPCLLSLALSCGSENTSKNPDHRKGKNPKTAEPEARRFLNQGKATVPKSPKRPALPREAAQLKSKLFEELFASLNDSQGEALHQILTSPLSATIGPPGTGKTRLITAVAKAWLHARGQGEILLCTAYQNVAARNLAEALAEEQVPGVLLLVSEDYFVDWHETFYEKLGKSVVVTKTRCEIPGALEDWRTRNKRSSVPILVCTLGLVGSAAFMTSLMGGKVTAMVIDECSQAAEGSCIYPLISLPDLSLLTVLGDPYQLPPFSGSASRSIRVPSIFDLVSNGCEVKLLKEQYRMPPTICRFISSEIYQDELQTAPNRWKEGDWHHPLLWVDVQGTSTKDPGKTSVYNTAEAQAILEVCQKLTKYYTKKGIVVLTLYEEQNRRISKLLEAENLQERVSVHNVDSFQGQQSEIVLISLVAGKHFSPFAADRHRACVMLTRVKRCLCVCGNYEAVHRNPQALLWKSLADFCGAHGLVVSLQDVESLLIANLLGTTCSIQDSLPINPVEKSFQPAMQECQI